MSKFFIKRWSFVKVDKALDSIINHLKDPKLHPEVGYNAYYVGGTLCIDFDFNPSVCLNKNGRGFFYNFKVPSSQKEKSHGLDKVKFVVTNKMHNKILSIYQLVKGSKRKWLDPSTVNSINT